MLPGNIAATINVSQFLADALMTRIAMHMNFAIIKLILAYQNQDFVMMTVIARIGSIVIQTIKNVLHCLAIAIHQVSAIHGSIAIQQNMYVYQKGAIVIQMQTVKNGNTAISKQNYAQQNQEDAIQIMIVKKVMYVM
ncbi:MAG: hypothetical protein QXI89_02195 [Candidatus Anstonellales archaeon]